MSVGVAHHYENAFGFTSSLEEEHVGFCPRERINAPQRPSHHDLLFHCGSDGAAENQAGVRYFECWSISSIQVSFLIFSLKIENSLCLTKTPLGKRKKKFRLMFNRTSSHFLNVDTYRLRYCWTGNKPTLPRETRNCSVWLQQQLVLWIIFHC